MDNSRVHPLVLFYIITKEIQILSDFNVCLCFSLIDYSSLSSSAASWPGLSREDDLRLGSPSHPVLGSPAQSSRIEFKSTEPLRWVSMRVCVCLSVRPSLPPCVCLSSSAASWTGLSREDDLRLGSPSHPVLGSPAQSSRIEFKSTEPLR